MQSVQAVAFDLDGTLVDTTPAHGEAYRRAFASFDIEIDRDAFAPLAGRHHSEIIQRLAGEHHQSIDPTEVHRRKTAEYRRLAPHAVAPLPLLGLVRTLHGSLPLALVTSATYETASASLDGRFDISAFDCVIAADHVLEHKPSPEPYLAAARSLGVEPAAMLVFEDSSTGIRSAYAAGCSVVHVSSESKAWVGQ